MKNISFVIIQHKNNCPIVAKAELSLCYNVCVKKTIYSLLLVSINILGEKENKFLAYGLF